MFALAVALLAAVVTPLYWSLLASPERLRWTLVDAGEDGRSIIITTTKEGGSCRNGDLPKATVERDSPDEIRVRVVQHDPVALSDALDPVRSDACAGVGIGRSRFTLRLREPVGGRRITGPGYRPKLATQVRRWSYDQATRASLGRVVGLRLDDARRVLRSFGIVRPVVIGPPDDAATVVAQDPPAGTKLLALPDGYQRTFDRRLKARLTVKPAEKSR